MSTHYCVSNPCWICFPEYAPKLKDSFGYQNYLQNHVILEDNISELLENLIIEVFDQGLDEDRHFRSIGSLTLDNIKDERAKISNDSLKAKLLDLMIKDFEEKSSE